MTFRVDPHSEYVRQLATNANIFAASFSRLPLPATFARSHCLQDLVFPVQAASARTLMRRLDRIPLCNWRIVSLCLLQRDTLRTWPLRLSPASVYINWKNRKFLYFLFDQMICCFLLYISWLVPIMPLPPIRRCSLSICTYRFHGPSFSKKRKKESVFFFFLLCTFLRPLDVVGMSPKQFPQLWIIHQILFKRSSYSN